MRKIIVTLLMLITAVSFMSAYDFGADDTRNLNKVFMDNYKSVNDFIFVGAVNVKYSNAEVTSVALDNKGMFTVIGRANAKQYALDVWAMQVFVKQIRITHTAKGKVMVVTTQLPISVGGGKLF